MTKWYENGQIETEGSYQEGKGHGKLTKWYENGQKASEKCYRDGEPHGKWTEWYENGQIKPYWSTTLSGSSNAVIFSPDGTTLASGSSNLKLWSVSEHRVIATLKDSNVVKDSNVSYYVNSVAFSPDGTTLASGETTKKTFVSTSIRRNFFGRAKKFETTEASFYSTIKLWSVSEHVIATLKGTVML